jgi:DNA-binding CsgD family transcriptional regulator/PAS domain-containing protein
MRQPIGPAALSEMIGSIYDCAVDPQRWPETLKHIQNELNFGGASLSVTEVPSGNVLLEIMSLPKFIARWAKLVELTRSKWGPDAAEMWGGLDKFRSLPLGEPIVLSQLRNRLEWTNNPTYSKWGRRFGIHDILAIGLARDSTMLGSLALVRLASQGDIGDVEIEASWLLIPHLQRALAISKLLDVKSVAAATFETALDTLAVAVILTDADLRIVHANAAARKMFVSRGSLRSEGGKLALRSSAAAAALALAVQQAARNEAAIGKRGLGVPATGADGAPSVLHVLPLNHGELRPGLAPSAVAAIFVAPAVSPTAAPHNAVAALFDLTQAEARVFAQIAEGKTQAEIADALGIESSTVKTHLLHIFAKTGTHRQADLVKLAASMALPL